MPTIHVCTVIVGIVFHSINLASAVTHCKQRLPSHAIICLQSACAGEPTHMYVCMYCDVPLDNLHRFLERGLLCRRWRKECLEWDQKRLPTAVTMATLWRCVYTGRHNGLYSAAFAYIILYSCKVLRSNIFADCPAPRFNGSTYISQIKRCA